MTLDFKKLQAQTPEERESARLQRYEELVVREEEYKKILSDCAQRVSRLTAWEISFVSSLRKEATRGNQTRKEDLTKRQLAVLEQIERKVYAVG